MNRTLVCGVEDVIGAIPHDGEILIHGPVGAVWQVRWAKLLSGDRVAINLEPFDPNDVPLDAYVRELPMVPMGPEVPSAA